MRYEPVGMPEEPFRSPASDPLILSGREPFARGSKRHCYVHPADAALCVKVAAHADGPDGPDGQAQQRQDLEDYALLKKRGGAAIFDRIPEIEGVVETDLGPGIVMQMFRDADGGISRNLAEIIRERGLSPALGRAIDDLKRWQREQRLLTRDSGPHNVLAVCLGGDAWKLVIAEGWQNRRQRWLARLHPRLRDYLIGRQLRKFDRRVAHLTKGRPGGS